MSYMDRSSDSRRSCEYGGRTKTSSCFEPLDEPPSSFLWGNEVAEKRRFEGGVNRH